MVDESYFGGHRKGNRRCGAGGKLLAFGLLKRGWRGYNALDVSEFNHYRINHSNLFADKGNHIKGVANF